MPWSCVSSENPCDNHKNQLKNQDYIPCAGVAAASGIRPGSLLVLTADLTRLAFTARKKEGVFSPENLIDGFLDQLGPEGTLVIPSYNFNLRNGDSYSRSRTLPVTGALAAAAMGMGRFRRSAHPLHSFLIAGKYTPEISSLTNRSSFGPDSPFAFFREHDAQMLVIGTPLSQAFTFVHFVEESAQAWYRSRRRLEIYLEDEHRRAQFEIFSKKPGWTMDMTGLESLLVSRGLARSFEINRVPFALAGLAASFGVILEDIRSNRARNIVRFSPKLYLRDQAKAVLSAFGFHTLSDKISHDPGLL